MESLDNLKEELEDLKGQKLTHVRVLFLDISSSCTGYAVASVDFNNKKANIDSTGAIWLNPNWSHQEKYSYMFQAMSTYFWIVQQVDYIVVEQYMLNAKKAMGTQVVPEMQGAIKAGAWENGVKVDSILPQSWRSTLGIKKDPETGSYKEPTKVAIEELVQLPEKVVSNITGKERQTPYDVYDALGVGLAWLERMNFKKVTFSELKVNPHIGHQLGGY